MQIFNLSYNDSDRFDAVYQIAGKPYSLLKSISMGGTGSPPLFLHSGPDEIMNILNQTYDRKYCNIELATRGIVFRFKSRLENYGVPIAFSSIKQIGFLKGKDIGREKDRILEINSLHGILRFLVRAHEVQGMIKFFSKPAFSGISSF